MTYFKKYLPALILCVLQFSLNAQIGNTAPNFTATDTHGETHTLYDYLEDGKVVVIDFFYTTCGPCQFYTPQVNLAFEKYGCNTADVIFIALDWGDSDAEVIAYDEEFGIQYPSISGVDGGANAIINDYNVSSFPTFYVIDSTKKIIDEIDPPTLQVFDFRFGIHGISPAECAVTSLSDLNARNQLRLFPNPVSFSDLDVEFPDSLSGKATLEVFNVYGKTVSNIPVNLSGNLLQISTDQLSPGTYFIKIKTLKSGDSFSGMFIKF